MDEHNTIKLQQKSSNLLERPLSSFFNHLYFSGTEQFMWVFNFENFAMRQRNDTFLYWCLVFSTGQSWCRSSVAVQQTQSHSNYTFCSFVLKRITVNVSKLERLLLDPTDLMNGNTGLLINTSFLYLVSFEHLCLFGHLMLSRKALLSIGHFLFNGYNFIQTPCLCASQLTVLIYLFSIIFHFLY